MTAKTFLAKLNAAAATAKRTEKLAIVKSFDAWDRRAAKAALDPTISYYIAKLLPPVKTGSEGFGEAEWALLEALAQRTLTGNAALEQVNFSLHDLSPEDGEVLRRITLKDLRCGVGATLVNTAFPGDITEHSYMRCSLPKDSNIDKWDWAAGVYCQLKADGSFARVARDKLGAVTVTTRQGNTYPSTPAMDRLMEDAEWCFKRGTETHGELTIWINGELQPRTIGNGMLNSLQQGGGLPHGAEIRFDCWDQVPLELAVPKGRVKTPYKDRHAELVKQVSEAGRSSIMLIEGSVVHSKTEAMALYRGFLARGLEGAILKQPMMEWSDSTSKDSVKWKVEIDVDLELVGFRPGEPGKRTEATFGALLCRTEDGLLEVGVSGLKREVEKSLWDRRDEVIGSIICVKANGVMYPQTEGGLHSLFLPRFIELRSGDKYRPDTLQEVIDQFASAQ